MKHSEKMILIGMIAVLLCLLGLIVCHATPQPGTGQWQATSGYNFQCYTCPDSGESDCIAASPIWLEVVRDGRVHCQEFNPTAYSIVNGMQYQGHLVITVLTRQNEIASSLLARWVREDGFTVQIAARWLWRDGVLVSSEQNVGCQP